MSQGDLIVDGDDREIRVVIEISRARVNARYPIAGSTEAFSAEPLDHGCADSINVDSFVHAFGFLSAAQSELYFIQ